MKGKAGGKKDKAGTKKKRHRSPPPADVLRNADTVRNVAATLERRGLPNSLRSVAREVVRRWLNARRQGGQTITAPVPDLMKRQNISESSARRGLKGLRELALLVPVAVKSDLGGGTIFTRLDAPQGGFQADKYWCDAVRLADLIEASESLAAELRNSSAPPPWEPERGVNRGVRGVSERGVSEGDIPEQNQCDTPYATACRHFSADRGVSEGDISEQNPGLNENDRGVSFSIVSRAHADLASCSGSASGEVDCPADEAEHPAVIPYPAGLLARQTEAREEANRDEPSPFTEKPSLPPALPVQEEPDASTCVVLVAPREGCPTARAFGVLHHLRVNGPATYGATASDMGISFGDAWRARDQLQRIGAIEIDRIGQMVPAPRA
jgi:DNA-binding Lrp family transcriptional regulator